MKKKNFLQDENAVAEALGVVLIVGIVLSATTIYLSVQVPEWTKDYESMHADDVADEFSEQDSLIDGIVLIAKAKREDEIAGGTTPIKMAPDKVPIFGMSPPGSGLNSLPDDESFVITPTVKGAPTPPLPVQNFSWVEDTTDDFENGTAKRVNVVVTNGKIRLSRADISGDLILNNTNATLSGELHYNTVRITNNSTVNLVFGNYLKLYANTIFIDATSRINADDLGCFGADGGKSGTGTGAGTSGSLGSGGGGAGHNGTGGDGGCGGISGEFGEGGPSYGGNSSFLLDFGSGGGGGAYGNGSTGAPHQGQVGGDGGHGGGAVFLDATQLNIFGTISANGADGFGGLTAAQASGGGGGGSGGTITIRGDGVNLSSALLSAKGGAGGVGGDYAGGGGNLKANGGGGGGGAGGRIKIFYDSAYVAPIFLGNECDGGAKGVGGKINAAPDGEDGTPGNDGEPYENQTTYISSTPHNTFGYYESRVYDTGNTTTCYGNITFDAYTDDYTSIVMKVRTSIFPVMDDINATMWENCEAVANGQDISELNSAFDYQRYVQYRAELFTYDTSTTPVLDWVRINYFSSNPEGGDPEVANSSGILKFNSNYLYYPNQEIVYEHGAVIKCQGKGEWKRGLMLHSPPINITNESGPTIRISMINLTGSDHSYSGSTTTSVENSYKKDKDSYERFSTTFNNLTLKLDTEYPYIWGKWFNKTLEETTLIPLYHYNVSVNATAKNVAVEFYGHVHDGGHGVQLNGEKTAVEVKI